MEVKISLHEMHGKHLDGTSNACHTWKEANKFGRSTIGNNFI
jgi:hypothetical protein